MKYLIVQDWASTHGNHAGMVHMCNMLSERYPDDYKVIVKRTEPIRTKCNSKFLKKVITRYDIWHNQRNSAREYMNLCKSMFSELKLGDSVFLLEYCWKPVSQYELACYIKKNFQGVNIYALSHMTPDVFEECKYRNTIIEWSKPVDKMLTLGSSLSKYFGSLGVPISKISTGFHYVDDEYYHKDAIDLDEPKRPVIIAMGSMKRDYDLLDAVVRNTPDVDWIICKGRRDVGDMLKYPNVTLKGYMEEDELRSQMLGADLSFNVMIDTVGSNVITTSMACGLGLIVSDVGSIRDYCDDSNAVFCENTIEDFSNIINTLVKDSKRVYEMRINSLNRVEQFQIAHVNDWFNNL